MVNYIKMLFQILNFTSLNFKSLLLLLFYTNYDCLVSTSAIKNTQS